MAMLRQAYGLWLSFCRMTDGLMLAHEGVHAGDPGLCGVPDWYHPGKKR